MQFHIDPCIYPMQVFHVERTPLHIERAHTFHGHEGVEVNVVLKGTMRYLLPDNQIIQAMAGQFMLFPPHFPHCFAATEPVGFYGAHLSLPLLEQLCHSAKPACQDEVVTLSYLPAPSTATKATPAFSPDLTSLLRLLPLPRVCYHPTIFRHIHQLFRNLTEEQMEYDPLYLASFNAIARMLGIQVIRLIQTTQQMQAHHPAHQSIMDVKDWIDQQESLGGVSVPQLAEMAHLAPTYFTNLFSHLLGNPPRDYLLGRRMYLAAIRLQSTLESVESIALTSGYTHVPNFVRAFKQHFGTTPTAYRHS